MGKKPTLKKGMSLENFGNFEKCLFTMVYIG
jgi:hypothetical protein